MVCLPRDRLLTLDKHAICPLCYQEHTYDPKMAPQPEFKEDLTTTREQDTS